MNRERLDDLIVRCMEGSLAPAERAELLRELKCSSESAQHFAEVYDMSALTAAAVEEPDAFSRSVRAQLSGNKRRGGKRFATNVIHRVQKDRLQSWSGRLKIACAVGAAAIVLIVAGIWLKKPVPKDKPDVQVAIATPLAELKVLAGGATVERNGERIPVTESKSLLAGDRVVLSKNSSAQAAYTDGTKLELSADAILRIGEAGQAADAGKRVVIESGHLNANVSKQPEGKPLVITSPQATTEVIGTTLTLVVDNLSTRLEVASGQVRFTRRDGGVSVLVKNNEYSVALANTPLEVLKIGTKPDAAIATRDPALWPFAVTSPWNYPIGSGARYAAIAAQDFNPSRGATINCREFSHPVFIMKPTDPVQNIFALKETKPRHRLRVPTDARGDLSQWGTMHLIDREQMRVYEMWETKRLSNGDLNVHEIVANDLGGSGIPGREHVSRVSGVAGIAGLIRKGELNSGIRHVLAMSIINTAISRMPEGRIFVWPVPEVEPQFGKGRGGNVFFGSLLAIPPDVNVAELAGGNSGPLYEIARALQDYGGYIVESFGGGSMQLGFFAEPAAEGEIPAGLEKKLGAVMAKLQVVTNNGPQSVGGGGTPRRPFAPPLPSATKTSTEGQF